MNIGIFTDTYHPQISGVVTSARILEKELNKLGHKVYIFTASDPNAEQMSPRVFRLPSVPFIFLRKTHRMVYFYPPKMIRKAKKLKLDVVHTYTEFSLGFFGLLLAKIYKLPVVHTYHTMYEDYLHYVANGKLISRKGAQRFCRTFCNKAKMVVAPADKTKNYLSTIGVIKPIRVIPTGMDFEQFDPARFSQTELIKTRTEFGINTEDKVVAVIGRVAKEKSIDVLIKMMPRLLELVPEAKMLIVGDGPYRETLTQLVRELHIEKYVIFAGFRPWDELGKYYRTGDVFATASTSESQGLTHIEAMAALVPVVIKKDPSFEALIKHGETGFLFEKDEEAAETVAYALTHKEEAEKVAKRGFAAIQPLSAETFGLAMEALYKEVIG